MHNKNLIIINNEKISIKDKIFYCDNIDMKSIPEEFKKYFNVTLIARNSSIKRSHQINLDKVKISSNIISFIYSIFKTFEQKNSIYLITSITPYTFFSYIFLSLFRKKNYVYLRSNGYEEYKAIFGFIGPAFYYVMFKIITMRGNIISCQERLFKKNKIKIVFPSELNDLWMQNTQKALLDKPRLLYIGRLKIEKGIFSLIKIFNQISIDANLSIVGRIEGKKYENKKINYIGHGYNAPSLIKIYDNHNIFILPSFTEAHPKVIDESLARLRPVIIFEEIKHVIQNKKGIFVSKRNIMSLTNTINFIIENYDKIQQEMSKNKLPTKQDFIKHMNDILSLN